MVDFIGIERVQELVARRGVARFIAELAHEIEADYLRWDSFDKSPRHALRRERRRRRRAQRRGQRQL